jgi:hypothetical protein
MQYLPENGQAIMSQVLHETDATSAYCRFLSPAAALNSRQLPELLDGLLKHVGERGAHNLIVEVEEDSPAFDILRQNGFSFYARQQIWKIEKAPAATDSAWQYALSRDTLSIQILRNSLIPGQVQQIESSPLEPDGYVYFDNGKLLAYVEVKYGSRGIWMQPFVSLDAEPFDQAIADLIARLRPRAGRPIYVCLRSYQDWLRNSFHRIQAEPGATYTVMAKRTSLPLRVEDARRIPVANRSAEPTTPIHAPLPQAREPEWIRYDQTPNYR